MKIFICLFFIFLTVSCKTVDMEKVLDSGGGIIRNQGESSASMDFIESLLPPVVEPEIIIIERPIYIPQDNPPPPRPPVTGQAAVREASQQGIVLPSEYSYAAMIYDFHPDWVYEIYTQPLRVTSLSLQPSEMVLDLPFISDSERWSIGAGVSYENGIPRQHIYIRPAEPNLVATLIINTDRRVYNLIIRSFSNIYMPMVRWQYPILPDLPSTYLQPLPGTVPGSPGAGTQPDIVIDPRFLSFDYKITHSIFRKPTWMPELVFDDGQKTYISFPVGVLQASMPAVFDARSNVINYRVVEHVLVIDRLMEKMTVKLDGREIVIEKKRR